MLAETSSVLSVMGRCNSTNRNQFNTNFPPSLPINNSLFPCLMLCVSVTCLSSFFSFALPVCQSSVIPSFLDLSLPIDFKLCQSFSFPTSFPFCRSHSLNLFGEISHHLLCRKKIGLTIIAQSCFTMQLGMTFR